MRKYKRVIGWLCWLGLAGILFGVGRADLQIRQMNLFIIGFLIICFLLVIAFHYLYSEKQ